MSKQYHRVRIQLLCSKVISHTIRSLSSAEDFFTMRAVILAVIISAVAGGVIVDTSTVLERSHFKSTTKRRLWHHVVEEDLWKYNLTPPKSSRTGFLEQPLDHFDPLVKETFQQRYYVVGDYWQSRSHPVFVYIGGEYELGETDVAHGHHAEMAKTHGALLLGLEHRFYGQSINKGGRKLDQLQYLSSQQALADLAVFRDFAVKNNSMTGNNTWICFGGSYPGALSAWFRVKYPHLVYGAVASSAPVLAQENFAGYNEVVAASFGNPDFGSKECVGNTTQGFATIGKMLQEGKQAQLQNDFHLCQNLSNPNDTWEFLFLLSIFFTNTAQLNKGEGKDSDIGRLCANLTAGPNPYDNLRSIWYHSQGCIDVSFAEFIYGLKITSGSFDVRQWYFQKCTQFGFFKRCDKNTTCMFLSLLDLPFYLLPCEDVFNISASSVKRQTDFTNDYYGGTNPKGSRIVFVNGSIDPWHALSVLKDLSDTIKAVFIKGTSHCADMRPESPWDTPALKAGKLAIEKEVSKWLQEAAVQKSD